MMVPEQVQARPHRREDFVDLRLAGVGPRRPGTPERPRRFVGQEDVDVTQLLARLDLLAHEVAALVGQRAVDLRG